MNANLALWPTNFEAGWLAWVNNLVANSGGNTNALPNILFKCLANSSDVSFVNAGWTSDLP